MATGMYNVNGEGISSTLFRFQVMANSGYNITGYRLQRYFDLKDVVITFSYVVATPVTSYNELGADVTTIFRSPKETYCL